MCALGMLYTLLARRPTTWNPLHNPPQVEAEPLGRASTAQRASRVWRATLEGLDEATEVVVRASAALRGRLFDWTGPAGA